MIEFGGANVLGLMLIREITFFQLWMLRVPFFFVGGDGKQAPVFYAVQW